MENQMKVRANRYGIDDFESVQADRNRTQLNSHSYKCNQCDYAAVQAGNLKRHLKSHSGEKSYNCNQCDYSSVQACHLRRHLKTHYGENIALKM